MNVYGAAQEENKAKFLTELASLCSNSKEPYVVGGDFNFIRFTSKKNKDYGLSRYSNIFNSTIASQELIDLHMSGGRYTGSNYQTNPTLLKLDRFLVSKDSKDLFPSVMVHKRPREVSDHNPLILSIKANQPMKHFTFKFELS